MSLGLVWFCVLGIDGTRGVEWQQQESAESGFRVVAEVLSEKTEKGEEEANQPSRNNKSKHNPLVLIRTETTFQSQKLEEEKNFINTNNNKSLSLDPQRNHHYHQLRHYHRPQQQTEQQFYSILETNTQKKRALSPSPLPSIEYARLLRERKTMGENQNQHQHKQSSRLGEIVEVEGGHIVRSTGRKDRHSKVCTAKGPRDRRVRLSAHTAIQFYDVQDRLGYDRPSKAVDWLIKKAKAAIDELAELPAWNPSNIMADSGKEHESVQEEEENQAEIGGYGYNSSFLPPSLDSDAIADTIKSFFPMSGAAASNEASSSSVQFQNYPPDLLSRTSSHSQDLRLSLQSFQDPILLHQQHTDQTLFSGISGGWSDRTAAPAWNGGGGGGGFVFAPPPPFLGDCQMISQRGPLQSSNNNHSWIRAWTDTSASADQQRPLISGMELRSGGFSGFRIPARIQGEEEEELNDGTNRLSSNSSNSRH